MIKKTVYIFVSILLLTSCVTTRRVNYLQDLREKIPASSTSDSTAYKLRIGDKVFIKLSTLDDDSKKLFSGGIMTDLVMNNSASDMYSYTIFSDGSIEFPFIGEIKLVGLTTREAKDTIRTRLQPMVPDCDIDVKLVNAYFTVVGTAGAGRFEIEKEKLNIFQALAISGDLKPFSDRTKIHILRQNSEGNTEIKVFDVRNKDIMNSDYYYVQPNDVIYVQSFSGQFFGIESFNSIFSTITSTLSLGYLLYFYAVPLFQ